MASASQRPTATGAGRFDWLAAAVTTACVGAALAVAAVPAVGAALGRPAVITVLAGLLFAAVGASLFWSMGLRHEGIALRLVILVPIALSVVFTVALMLDTHFRGPGLAGGG